MIIHTASTSQQFNKLIEFRQAIYQQGLRRERDAQFELLDALLSLDADHTELSLIITRKPIVFESSMSSPTVSVGFLDYQIHFSKKAKTPPGRARNPVK